MARSHGGHEVIHADDPAAALAAAPEAEVAMGTLTPELFLAAPNLKWAHSFSAGLDKVLTPEVAELPFTLTNMAGKYAVQGGEHAWALLLALSRGVVHAAVARRWERGAVTSLTGGTLLIIGLGGFGMHTLRRAAGYDMTVLALDPVKSAGAAPEGVAELLPPTRENLHAFLARADAVAVTCPLVPETWHLIGAEELAQMKPERLPGQRQPRRHHRRAGVDGGAARRHHRGRRARCVRGGAGAGRQSRCGPPPTWC